MDYRTIRKDLHNIYPLSLVLRRHLFHDFYIFCEVGQPRLPHFIKEERRSFQREKIFSITIEINKPKIGKTPTKNDTSTFQLLILCERAIEIFVIVNVLRMGKNITESHNRS